MSSVNRNLNPVEVGLVVAIINAIVTLGGKVIDLIKSKQKPDKCGTDDKNIMAEKMEPCWKKNECQVKK